MPLNSCRVLSGMGGKPPLSTRHAEGSWPHRRWCIRLPPTSAYSVQQSEHRLTGRNSVQINPRTAETVQAKNTHSCTSINHNPNRINKTQLYSTVFYRFSQDHLKQNKHFTSKNSLKNPVFQLYDSKTPITKIKSTTYRHIFLRLQPQ